MCSCVILVLLACVIYSAQNTCIVPQVLPYIANYRCKGTITSITTPCFPTPATTIVVRCSTRSVSCSLWRVVGLRFLRETFKHSYTLRTTFVRFSWLRNGERSSVGRPSALTGGRRPRKGDSALILSLSETNWTLQKTFEEYVLTVF